MIIIVQFCIEDGGERNLLSTRIRVDSTEEQHFAYACRQISTSLTRAVHQRRQCGELSSDAHLVTHPHDKDEDDCV